jgi:UDP-glucose 4-epimerase
MRVRRGWTLLGADITPASQLFSGFRMARFLVTGGAGFMGSHLVDALVEQGHPVRVLDDLSTGSREKVSKRVEFIQGDVTDPRVVEQAFEGIEACFHLAAIASVGRSNREWLRTNQVNLTGTINVFDQARRLRHRRELPVVYASTAAVYGDCAVIPIDEHQPVAPLSAYAADKCACEHHARVAGAVHRIPTLGLRFFNLYGPRQNPRSSYSGVITLFADRLIRGEPVEIFGDGEQVRDFVYVGDAVSVLSRAMPAASTNAPVFNICTGKGTTVWALAQIMADLYQTDLVADYRPARSGDVRRSIGDPHLAAEQLDFRAETTLAEGLAITLDVPNAAAEYEPCP